MAVFERLETKDGRVRWKMRVFVGRDENGKRKFIVETFDRKGDAERRARKLEGMKDGGAALTVTSKEPFGEYLERWLRTKDGQVRARTADDYRNIVRRYVTDPPAGAPVLRSIPLNRLSREAFQELVNFLWDEGKSPRTIQYCHTVLRMALKDAVSTGILVANPTDGVTLKRMAKDGDEIVEEEKTVRAMDQEQASRFMEAAKSDRYHALWLVLILGGLRPSEALGLGWKDVDLAEGRVFIHRTLTRRGVEGWKLTPTKTKKSRRNVTLPARAIAALKEWKAVQARERLLLGAEYEDNGFVFTNEFGRPLDDGNLYNRNFRRVMAEAGLGEWEGQGKSRKFRPAFRMYDLRHTCATMLLLAGESLKVVSERLGHSTIVLTADTYSHVLPSMQQGAADRLDAMFGVA